MTEDSSLPLPLLDALREVEGTERCADVVNRWAAQSGLARAELRAVLDRASVLLEERCAAPVRRVGLRVHPAHRLRFR